MLSPFDMYKLIDIKVEELSSSEEYEGLNDDGLYVLAQVAVETRHAVFEEEYAKQRQTQIRTYMSEGMSFEDAIESAEENKEEAGNLADEVANEAVAEALQAAYKKLV